MMASLTSTDRPVCRVCAATDFQVVQEVPYNTQPGTCRFGVCQACGCVADLSIFEPSAQAGSFVGYRYGDVKFYVEYGASLEAFAGYLDGLAWLHARSGRTEPPRLLDVGAAFGFCVAMAEARGWSAVGVEPSEFAPYGRQFLGIEIHHDYLENTPLPRHSFDYLIASDVVEHVPYPRQFIELLASYLKPDGVLLISTPNSRVVVDVPETEIIDVLSPGAHMTLFSPSALETMLHAAGFQQVHIRLSGGASSCKAMLALAARQSRADLASVPWAEFDVPGQVRACLERITAQKEAAGQFDILYSGALFKLFQQCYGLGDRAGAKRYAAMLDHYLVESGWDASHLAQVQASGFYDYLAHTPAYAGAYYALRGRLAFEDADFRLACDLLTIAIPLLEIEKRTGIYPRAGWVERARYERARAALRCAEPAIALADFDILLEDPPAAPASLKELYTEKTAAHLRLRHWRQALRWWVRGAEQPPYHRLVHPLLALATGLWRRLTRPASG